MWSNKQQQAEAPTPPSHEQKPMPQQISPATPTPSVVARPSAPAARSLACLGHSIEIKGIVTGSEDMQIDGKVDGPVSLQGQKLTVGPSGQMSSQITAREIVVYGKVTGNLRARDRVEIKKDGSVIGDITTARISIEDGAYFKGRIEIEKGEKGKAPAATDRQEAPVSVLTGAT
jgi:cytoskeletal protein CcmA (bactofilin family)